MSGAADFTAPRLRVLVGFWLLLIGAALHDAMILEARPLLSANDRSRWCTVWSLVERQTYRIDEIRQVPGWDTIDLVRDDGHFYSTKPPILATWVAGIAWCVCRMSGWDLLSHTQYVTSVTLLFANGLPLLLSWYVFHRLLKETVSSAWGHALLLSTAIFATLVTPFAVTLNNHSIAAAGAMFTVYALWQILRTGQPSWGWFAACGFASAWTCAHELPAALLGLCTFFLCLRRDAMKTAMAYLPAAIAPLGFFFLTNWLATGGFKPAYADYGTEKYRFVIDGVPSYWMEPKGIDLNPDSLPVYIFHCLIGHHGIFSLTPVWLLLIPAWIMAGKSPRGRGPAASIAHDDLPHEKPTGHAPSVAVPADHALRTLSRLSLFLTIVVLTFYFSRTENHNYGGVSCGLRWALWLTPFWLTALIPAVNAWAEAPALRWLIVPLFAISAFSAWSRIDNPWRHPWIFTWMESRGWIDLREPRPPFAHKLWTWFATLPDVSDGHPRWIELANPSAIQNGCRLRLQAEPAPGDSNFSTLLTITRTCGTSPAETVCRVLVDRQAFENGAEPAKFLRWPDAAVTPEKQQSDLAFLRGLPLLKEFRPGVFRYRKTRLRTDAFRAQQALAEVEMTAENQRYRVDAWLCDELPFGVAEVEFQVHDATTGLLLHQERWQAAASEPPALPHAQWSPPP